MVGHYVRVQEAASILGVSPATIRWYSLHGWLPTYRVGRGTLTHRRFRYPDVARVARRTGRLLPEEPTWHHGVPITVDMASQYLGLSARYLMDTGYLTAGALLTWEELMVLEGRIYGGPVAPTSTEPVDREENPDMMMSPMRKKNCGCGCGSHKGRQGAAAEEPQESGWPATNLPPDDASLVVLRRAKRHLEVQKADLEDHLVELERRIRQHSESGDKA